MTPGSTGSYRSERLWLLKPGLREEFESPTIAPFVTPEYDTADQMMRLFYAPSDFTLKLFSSEGDDRWIKITRDKLYVKVWSAPTHAR